MSVTVRKPLDYDPWTILDEACRNTDDWERLKEINHTQEEFLIFVQGNLRRNRRENHLLKGCNFYGMAHTYDKTFILKRSPFDTGREVTPEPVAFEFPEREPELREEFKEYFNTDYLGRIEGDLYGIPLRILTVIDEHQGNNEGVIRKSIWVNMTQQGNEPKPTKAFMYLTDYDFFREYASYSVPKMISCNCSHDDGGRLYYFSS